MKGSVADQVVASCGVCLRQEQSFDHLFVSFRTSQVERGLALVGLQVNIGTELTDEKLHNLDISSV